MSNNYTSASFVVGMTEDEMKVWQQIDEIVGIFFEMWEGCNEDDPEFAEKLKAYPEGLVDRVRPIAKLHEDWGYDLDWEKDGEGAWFHHDESINMEQVVAFLELWAELVKLDKPIVATWACTCSKPRVGEFDGGGVVITKDGSHWFSGSYLAGLAVDGLHMPKGDEQLNQLMSVHSLQMVDLMALLGEFLDEEPDVKYRFSSFVRRKSENRIKGEEQETCACCGEPSYDLDEDGTCPDCLEAQEEQMDMDLDEEMRGYEEDA